MWCFQVFKNSLTGLAMGGGKGGSDFDPRGRSDAEVHAFCQAFMLELSRHIGPDTDVPAGDINVGGREIGYLFGAYKKIMNKDQSVLTGKGLNWGGSLIRPEATGYGCVYFGEFALKGERGLAMKGLKCVVSGSGNVAQYTVEKLIELGALPVSVSDSGGCLVKPAGLTTADLAVLIRAKTVDRVRLEAVASKIPGSTFTKGSIWSNLPAKIDAAYPSATQNEVDAAAATALVEAGCKGVFEGANMPCTRDAVAVLKRGDVVYGPGKAANAGGVGVSGLEMAQNASRANWSRAEVDGKLKDMMAGIYAAAVANAPPKAGAVRDLEVGANRAGFLKVASAMHDLGWI